MRRTVYSGIFWRHDETTDDTLALDDGRGGTGRLRWHTYSTRSRYGGWREHARQLGGAAWHGAGDRGAGLRGRSVGAGQSARADARFALRAAYQRRGAGRGCAPRGPKPVRRRRDRHVRHRRLELRGQPPRARISGVLPARFPRPFHDLAVTPGPL